MATIDLWRVTVRGYHSHVTLSRFSPGINNTSQVCRRLPKSAAMSAASSPALSPLRTLPSATIGSVAWPFILLTFNCIATTISKHTGNARDKITVVADSRRGAIPPIQQLANRHEGLESQDTPFPSTQPSELSVPAEQLNKRSWKYPLQRPSRVHDPELYHQRPREQLGQTHQRQQRQREHHGPHLNSHLSRYWAAQGPLQTCQEYHLSPSPDPSHFQDPPGENPTRSPGKHQLCQRWKPPRRDPPYEE